MKKIGSGKVREIFEVNENELLLVTSDRISAFDVILDSQIPGKGKVLNLISKFWFDQTKDLIPNHLIEVDENEGNKTRAHKLEMLPIEAIVRGYISGSAFQDYQKTGAVFGKKYPQKLENSQKLPEPIFTPTTKASEGHDENISYEEVEELIGKDLAKQVKDISIKLYNFAADLALQKGIIIADTKFEFGLKDGKLYLGDEVLTPDSSRFWDLKKYQIGKEQDSFDKQIVRNYLIDNGLKGKAGVQLPQEIIDKTAQKYQEIYQILTQG